MSNTAKFDLLIQIESLSNIPLNAGEISIHWHLKDSRRAAARGKSNPVKVESHRAVLDYSAMCVCKLHIDTNTGQLKPSMLVLDILWHHEGRSSRLGSTELNLSPHVIHDGDPTGENRKKFHTYLLQKSRINCGVKSSLSLRYQSGNQEYLIPKFDPPKVFSEITGIIDFETKTPHDDSDRITKFADTLKSNSTFEFSWAARAGSLKPSATIEDIFAGGDGFDRGSQLLCPLIRRKNVHALKETSERENLQSWTIGSGGDDI